MQSRCNPEETARAIWQERYPAAAALFLSGSVVRGEATAHSDLDIVVVFPEVETAWRESFHHNGWPVEAFVHDRQTLAYFFHEIDAKSGCPALPQMVAEGVVIAGGEFAASLKEAARKVLDAGPPTLTPPEISTRRYGITDLLDDMREPRSSAELMATGTKLFAELADFHLRANGLWSASGKTVIRRLRAVDGNLSQRFEEAFSRLFADSNPGPCITLAEEILSTHGGLLFDGYRLDAPASWRSD